MRLDAFGQRLEVERWGEQWQVFLLGNDGTRRPAVDIKLPPTLPAEAVPDYIDDLLHESATPERPHVVRLD